LDSPARDIKRPGDESFQHVRLLSWYAEQIVSNCNMYQMSRSEDLRERAAKARRLASSMTDAVTADRLIAYAMELEARADEIERAASVQQPRRREPRPD
jgi:hypothetical protein